MMKNLFNILCCLMAIAMTACTQEQLVEGQSIDNQDEKVNVKAYAPGGDMAGSRIVFQENEGDEPTVSLSWSTEESFSVVRGSEVRTFSKNTAGNTFTGTLPTDGTGDYHAFYPATASADLPVDLSVQTGALDSKLTYMYASSTDGMVYEFQHCVGENSGRKYGYVCHAVHEVLFCSLSGSREGGDKNIAMGTNKICQHTTHLWNKCGIVHNYNLFPSGYVAFSNVVQGLIVQGKSGLCSAQIYFAGIGQR
jgi:hypothetical protein